MTKNNVQSNYCLPKDFQLQLLREGPDNDVFWVKNNQEKKIMVVRVSKRDVKEDVLFEIRWLIALKNKGIPVPEVIDTKSGKSFFIDKKGQVYVAFKYIEGVHVKIKPDTKPDLKLVVEAAKMLSQMHNASLDISLSLSRKRNILTEINRALNIKERFIRFSEGGNKFIDELAFYKEWAEKNGNNKYLVHNDYRPGNVFFDGDRVSTILDFDWSCRGPAIKDVAHSLVEWSFPSSAEKHWQDVFNFLLKGYNQEAKNKIKLNNSLYHWICFSCLSDAATYLVDLANENTFKNVASSYMYQKFLYFERFIK